ncbi:NAD+ synthase [Lyngbya sp. PCC 8106]|uniref:NAD+ synthase n=1 Tax=Lyngbya sp. (strain PCC 8106) TaxID=313612 RepID=UPI0000EA95BA|nr:NAD+ synthase [Lyngbya sp. PCC 8106]EAW35005.1 NAD(+) synthetase [Lyngbya sp. PCC 8106]
MKIAIAQLNPTVGDITGNAQRILDAAKQATEAGCQLLLTTELALVGYPPRDLLNRPSFIEAAIAELQVLAAKIPPELTVLVGTVQPNSEFEKQGEKPLFNSAALIQNSQVQQFFQKRLLPTYDVFDEDRYFEGGKQSKYFTLSNSTSSLKIGVTICEDLWNDEEFWGRQNYTCNPMKALAEKEVDLVVNLSASPYQASKQKLRQAMLGHSAKRYSTPIIYANQVGGNDDLIFDGFSLVFNKTGELVQYLTGFETDFTVVEFDLEKRDVITSDWVKSLDQPQSSFPESEDEEIWLALVLGVRDYLRKCGFSQVVLGLSGGIDSSLVAAIAAEAVGKENVLGVLMPSPYSSEHSVTDAVELAENLGINTKTLAIAEAMKAFDQVLEPVFAGTEFGIAEENIQSRIRGTLLMAISNKFGHLLLSTGNKSEMAVGYCTLYGDMNGGLAVIADVPKIRVYSICKWLNQHSNKEIIPNNILTKPASAELKPGQMDSDSLPPYEILDDILHRLVEKQESVSQIIAAGHDSEIVQQVVKLVMRAEFKRRQAPPGLKISDRAFGTGWRMPIAKISSGI